MLIEKMVQFCQVSGTIGCHGFSLISILTQKRQSYLLKQDIRIGNFILPGDGAFIYYLDCATLELLQGDEQFGLFIFHQINHDAVVGKGVVPAEARDVAKAKAGDVATAIQRH